MISNTSTIFRSVILQADRECGNVTAKFIWQVENQGLSNDERISWTFRRAYFVVTKKNQPIKIGGYNTFPVSLFGYEIQKELRLDNQTLTINFTTKP